MDMEILFASFYLIPAALLLLGIWMVMRLVRALGGRYTLRRVVFVGLVTAFMAPAVVPAGTIMVAVVPNGLLVLSGSLPMLHQPRLVNFAILSHVITAAVAVAAAPFLVTDRREWPKPASGVAAAARVVMPVAVIAALLAFYYSLIPDRKIPAYIDSGLVEAAYGEEMDAVSATLEVEDLDAVRAERQRLAGVFEEDPAIIRVSLHDSRLDATRGETPEVYLRSFESSLRSSSRSCSSTGDGKYVKEGLMRCTWDAGIFGGLKTLKYQRRPPGDKRRYTVEIEFDYEVLLDRYPVPQ